MNNLPATQKSKKLTTEQLDKLNEIFNRIADGEHLVRICEEKHLPGTRQFYEWVKAEPHLDIAYSHAREVAADRDFAEIEELADSVTPQNYLETRLKIDTKKWIAGRRHAKYNDKGKVELTGANGGPIQLVAGAVDRPAPETREEWLARRQQEILVVDEND